MSKAQPKWTEDRTATLISIVGDTQPVTPETVAQAAESLECSTRSVASKLRKMEYEVQSTAKAHGKTYTAEEEDEITAFLEANPNEFTYAEIATQVCGGTRSAKQIQGKILSMDLTGSVKATEQVVRPKSYTDAEEAQLKAMVVEGEMFIEDIADKMGREVNSVRGKILSMSRTDDSITFPTQRTYKEAAVDPIDALEGIGELTVAEIAEKTGKTERGIKTLLTRRGIDCANHKGAARKAKNDAARQAA